MAHKYLRDSGLFPSTLSLESPRGQDYRNTVSIVQGSRRQNIKSIFSAVWCFYRFGRRYIFRCVRKIAKSDYWLRHVCMSVCAQGATRLPLDVFSLNFIFDCFSKICPENSSFIKIRQEKEVLYTTTNLHF